jgi:hypothetical protein
VGAAVGPIASAARKAWSNSASPPRRWHGHSVVRQVEVEYADGRHAVADLRLLVVPASQLAQQAAVAYSAAHTKEAEHSQRVDACWFAGGLMPRRPTSTMKAVDRNGGAVSRASGAIMRSTIVS